MVASLATRWPRFRFLGCTTTACREAALGGSTACSDRLGTTVGGAWGKGGGQGGGWQDQHMHVRMVGATGGCSEHAGLYATLEDTLTSIVPGEIT